MSRIAAAWFTLASAQPTLVGSAASNEVPDLADFSHVTMVPARTHEGRLALRGPWRDHRVPVSVLGSAHRATNDAAWYRICVDWSAVFSDNRVSNGLSDDYVRGTSSPAAYATSTILTDELVPQVVWSGHLDAEGCAPPRRLNRADKLTVLAMTDLVKPDGAEIVITYTDAASSAPLVVAEWLSLPASGGAVPEVVRIATAVEDAATRVAAVAGRVLALDDLLPSGSITRIYADMGCPDAWARDANGRATEACGGAGAVHIGYVLDTAHNLLNPRQHNSQSKYIIAHELGHAIGGASFGLPHWAPGQAGVQSAACRCDHVDSGNMTHCMTSRQDQASAMNEAFGHFIAARAFNDPDETDCSFSYYKTSIDERGVKHAPPWNLSCTGAPRWLDTQCPGDAELGGTELDWLTFYYDVTRGLDAVTLPFLVESFRRACSGSPTGVCTRQHIYFHRMPKENQGREQPAMSLADAYCATLLAHGEVACATSARYARFLDEAAAHGIDH